MSRSISAIFSAGVFRPVDPIVDLPEGTPVIVQLEGVLPASADKMDPETKKSWSEFIDAIEALPDESPNDGFSGRDHDRILYSG